MTKNDNSDNASSNWTRYRLWGIIPILMVVSLANALWQEKSVGLFDVYWKNNKANKANKANTTTTSTTTTTDHDSGSCPCVSEYLAKLRKLNISLPGISYEEWQSALCRPPLPPERTSNRSFLLGAGPGTTATRSFSRAVAMLQKRVLHHKALKRAKLDGTSPNIMENAEKYKVDELFDGILESKEMWHSVGNISWADLLYDLDAVFDHPFPLYSLDILRAFPNAKVLMTHRDPKEWYKKRNKKCSSASATCRVPFLLRPFNVTIGMKHSNYVRLSKQQLVESYTATEQVIQCVIGPERYLEVDVWNPPPEGDWFNQIATFLDLPVPPAKAKCVTPQLHVTEEDDKHCFDYTSAHPEQYPYLGQIVAR